MGEDKPPPKLFSLFNRKPPSIVVSLESIKTTTTSTNSTLFPSIGPDLPTEPADLDVTLPSTSREQQTSRAASPASKKDKTVKRKLVIQSDEEDEASPELKKSSKSDLVKDMVIVEATTGKLKENSEVSLTETTKGKGKGKPKIVDHGEDEDDDDVVIIESTSTSNSLGTKSFSRSNPSSPKRRKTNSSLKVSTSSSLFNVITIPDSPPLEATKSLSFGTSSGFLPLSEIYRSSREKKLANEPQEVRWPTEEEHGIQHSKGSETRTNWNSLERWNTFEAQDDEDEAKGKGKGKGKAVEPTEVEKIQLLQSLTLPIPTLTSQSIPSSQFEKPPQLLYHSLHLVKELLPTSLPSHPLLNRLAEPFLVDMPHPSSFIRIHDRDDDDVMNQEGASDVNFQDMWTVKYAPKSAGEVLGTTSGESAKLLKDWMEELALANRPDAVSGEKKRKPRKVNREAFKPKAKRTKRESSENDWIVDDFAEDFESSEEEEFYENELEGADYVPRPQNAERNHRITFPTLTNLILLYGPSSSGKTSSVHAVANELGWEVFEVYPGIGKRSSKDVERYVGDVGKNHLVWGGGSDSKGKDPFAMFRSNKAPSVASSEVGVEEVYSPASVAKTKQSFILFDEVDILYKDDKEFWTGLADLAKECRRPIVLTCSEIPAMGFGLQEVFRNGQTQSHLRFEPPEPSIAIPFLQLVSLSEGHILPEITLSTLYNVDSKSDSTPTALFQYDGTLSPKFSISDHVLPQPDLRRALTQLQFNSQWAVGYCAIDWMDFTPNKNGRTAWSVPFEEVLEVNPIQVDSILTNEEAFAKEVLATELLSATDAFISPRGMTLIEDFEPGTTAAHVDTVNSISSLLERPLSHSHTQFPSSNDTRELVSYLSSSSLQLRAESFQQIDKDVELTIQTKMQSYLTLSELLTIPSFLVLPTTIANLSNSADLYLYYLPVLRDITTVDDLREIAQDEEDQDGQVKSRGARRSGRLNGNKFIRNIQWDEGVVEKVRESGF